MNISKKTQRFIAAISVVVLVVTLVTLGVRDGNVAMPQFVGSVFNSSDESEQDSDNKTDDKPQDQKLAPSTDKVSVDQDEKKLEAKEDKSDKAKETPVITPIKTDKTEKKPDAKKPDESKDIKSEELIKESDDKPTEPAVKIDEAPAKKVDTKDRKDKQAKKSDSKQTDTGGAATSFIAQPGDSYTQLARQAIAKYVADNKVLVSNDSLLNVEVALVNEAGSPYLEIGDQVTISHSQISSALAHVGVDPAPSDDEVSASKEEVREDDAVVVESGQTYTAIARAKITQDETGSQLSPAQKLASETYLASAAGMPELEIGSSVVIEPEALTESIKKASSLSPEELALWESLLPASGL